MWPGCQRYDKRMTAWEWVSFDPLPQAPTVPVRHVGCSILFFAARVTASL